MHNVPVESAFLTFFAEDFSCLIYVRRVTYMDMIRSKTDSPADVISWMESEAASLWPALFGSLSYRRTRCMQPNCAACQSGEQHRSYVLYGRHQGRRFAIYVP